MEKQPSEGMNKKSGTDQKEDGEKLEKQPSEGMNKKSGKDQKEDVEMRPRKKKKSAEDQMEDGESLEEQLPPKKVKDGWKKEGLGKHPSNCFT